MDTPLCVDDTWTEAQRDLLFESAANVRRDSTSLESIEVQEHALESLIRPMPSRGSRASMTSESTTPRTPRTPSTPRSPFKKKPPF